MKIHCVLCEVGNESLYVMWLNLSLLRVYFFMIMVGTWRRHLGSSELTVQPSDGKWVG